MRNLITPQEVIDLAFAENSNMMAESISDTAIRIAEIKYIRPAFGVMYPLLADKYADYTNDYVKPALAYFVKCEIVSSIAIDMSNSGVAVANPQYQSAATDKQRQRLYDSEMSKAKTLLDFALEYIATHSEEFPDFSGEAPKKHHRLGGILLGGVGVSKGQSASITGDAFKAEFDKYIKEMGETAEEVEQLIGSTGAITEEAKKATNNANIATAQAEKATENANNAGAEAVRIATYAANETTTAKEKAEQATEQAKVATANANTAAQRANEEVENLRDKADIDKYYPLMSVGMADNLVGRGDVQDAQINFRPSAGADNITDGAARIERIKGNSVVWNQLVNMDSTSVELVAKRTYFTDIDGEHSVRIISATTTIEAQSGRDKVVDLTKMFGAGNEPTTVEEYYQGKPMNIEDEFAYNEGTLVDMHADTLVSVGDNAFDGVFEQGAVTNGLPTNIGLSKSNIFTKNLIKVVPNKEYYALLPNYNGNQANIYWNWYDRDEEFIEETKYLKNVVAPANACYLRVMIYVEGGIAPDYKGFQISLLHSGWKAAQMIYQPYETDTKDLTWIKGYFPNGMRSAGSAYDEIRFNPTKKVWEKVERVGVRAYAEGDAEDSSVITDGETTNYPLDNPTPTTIPLSPNLNLDYLVWDFGTEEAMASVPSAPFRADINYEPNAVDDLRWAVSEIRSLRAELAQLQSAQTSETNLTE